MTGFLAEVDQLVGVLRAEDTTSEDLQPQARAVLAASASAPPEALAEAVQRIRTAASRANDAVAGSAALLVGALVENEGGAGSRGGLALAHPDGAGTGSSSLTPPRDTAPQAALALGGIVAISATDCGSSDQKRTHSSCSARASCLPNSMSMSAKPPSNSR